MSLTATLASGVGRRSWTAHSNRHNLDTRHNTQARNRAIHNRAIHSNISNSSIHSSIHSNPKVFRNRTRLDIHPNTRLDIRPPIRPPIHLVRLACKGIRPGLHSCCKVLALPLCFWSALSYSQRAAWLESSYPLTYSVLCRWPWLRCLS